MESSMLPLSHFLPSAHGWRLFWEVYVIISRHIHVKIETASDISFLGLYMRSTKLQEVYFSKKYQVPSGQWFLESNTLNVWIQQSLSQGSVYLSFIKPCFLISWSLFSSTALRDKLSKGSEVGGYDVCVYLSSSVWVLSDLFSVNCWVP